MQWGPKHLREHLLLLLVRLDLVLVPQLVPAPTRPKQRRRLAPSDPKPFGQLRSDAAQWRGEGERGEGYRGDLPLSFYIGDRAGHGMADTASGQCVCVGGVGGPRACMGRG